MNVYIDEHIEEMETFVTSRFLTRTAFDSGI